MLEYTSQRKFSKLSREVKPERVKEIYIKRCTPEANLE